MPQHRSVILSKGTNPNKRVILSKGTASNKSVILSEGGAFAAGVEGPAFVFPQSTANPANNASTPASAKLGT